MTRSPTGDITTGSIGVDQLGNNADQIYSALMKTHEGLSDNDSMRLNARLVLLMMNEISEPSVLLEIFAEGRRGLADR